MWWCDVMWCDLQAVTSEESSNVAAPESLTSDMSTSSPSITNVSVSNESTEHSVLLQNTPPRQTSSEYSPRETDCGLHVTVGSYKTIPVSEPDLSKVPQRSALKGGKTHQLKDQQDPATLHLSLNTVTTPPHPAAIQFISTGMLPRVPPKVAPKPRTGPWVCRLCMREKPKVMSDVWGFLNLKLSHLCFSYIHLSVFLCSLYGFR